MRPSEYRFNFAQQIGVGEHHALGIGSRAGGVEQGSDDIRFDGGRFEAARARSKDAVKIADQGSARIGIVAFCSRRIDERNLDGQRADRLPRGCEMFDVAK